MSYKGRFTVSGQKCITQCQDFDWLTNKKRKDQQQIKKDVLLGEITQLCILRGMKDRHTVCHK